MHTRRSFLCSSLLAFWGARTAPAGRLESLSPTDSVHSRLAKLESESGGRVGAAVFHHGTVNVIGYRFDERFPMCSTFKVLAVAAILRRVDRGKENLDRSVPIHEADILEYAPVTSHHVGPKGMTVAELCEAALTVSDNTAANLLLNAVDGPFAVTTFARSLGDSFTRLDRVEPSLNEAAPGDPRDTTTPRAMAKNLISLLCGNVLSDASRALLRSWMVESKTGGREIRSTLPASFTVGDKTGSGDHNTSNDVAVIWPPAKPPASLAIFLTGVRSDSTDRQALVAEVTRACLPEWCR